MAMYMARWGSGLPCKTSTICINVRDEVKQTLSSTFSIITTTPSQCHYFLSQKVITPQCSDIHTLIQYYTIIYLCNTFFLAMQYLQNNITDMTRTRPPATPATRTTMVMYGVNLSPPRVS